MRRLIVLLAACGDHAAVLDAPVVTLDTPSLDASPDATVHPDASTVGPVRLADVVVAAPGGGDTSNAVDGVQGGGADNGSMDVYSLGYTPEVNDSITLAWSNGKLSNGAGDDFAVFENPFAISGGGVFMDLIIVEVSRDGTTWRELAHDYTSPNQNVYSTDPMYWQGFAGKTPVLLNDVTNPVDPFDRAAAGGDGFDLDNVVGTDAEAVAIRANGVRYVRLVSAPARINPHTNAKYLHDSISNGADIDGVYGRYVIAE
jgi:hypothetical protein